MGGGWSFDISRTLISAAARLAEVVREGEDTNVGNNVHNVFGEGAVQRGEQRWIWYAIREWRYGIFPRLVEVAWPLQSRKYGDLCCGANINIIRASMKMAIRTSRSTGLCLKQYLTVAICQEI